MANTGDYGSNRSGLHANVGLARADAGLPEMVDLGQLVSALRQNVGFIVRVALGIFALVMVITLLTHMEFSSSGRLYLGELDANGRPGGTAAGELELSGDSEGEVGSEIEIIKSRYLVTQAILKSGLNVSLVRAADESPRLWQWLLARRDPALLDVGAREVRVVDAILADRIRTTQSYTIRFKSADEFELLTADGARFPGRLNEPMNGEGVKLTVIAGWSAKPVKGASYEITIDPIDETLKDVMDKLEVISPKAAVPNRSINVLSLQYSTRSPWLSAAFLDELMQGYLRARQSWKIEDASAAEAFVSSQLRTMKDLLGNVQQKLADYRTNNRVVVLDSEAKAMIEQIAKYEEQRVAARLQVAALSDIKRSLKGKDPSLGAYLFGEANDTVLEEMSSRLAQSRQKLTDLESRFSDAAPDIREQRALVDNQLESIRDYVSSRLSRAQESLGTLGGIIAQFETKLRTVPGAELGLAQLSRESEVYSRTYSYLLERQQQAAIVKASRLSKNRVLDAPQISLKEDSPRLRLRAASGVAGLLLGVALVLGRSLFGGSLQSESDVRRSIGSTPVLLTIPRRKDRGRSDKNRHSLFDAPAADDNRRFVEAFRALRTVLSRWVWAPTAQGCVILITSPNPGDGKTMCTWWLASALAADKKRVLRIDADLRKEIERLPAGDHGSSERGLRDVLTGGCQWREAVGRVSLPSGEHFAISAGGPARPEVLSSQQMANFLNEARTAFDFILIDSPSFPFVSDALALSLHANAIVTIVRLQHSNRAAVKENVHQLSQAGQPHAVIINDAGPYNGSKRRYPSAKAGTGTPKAGRGKWQKSWWAAAGFGSIIVGIAGDHPARVSGHEWTSGTSRVCAEVRSRGQVPVRARGA
ncbi:MAG: GNVR domain-containing protein [Pseudomonadota bacterium]